MPRGGWALPGPPLLLDLQAPLRRPTEPQLWRTDSVRCCDAVTPFYSVTASQRQTGRSQRHSVRRAGHSVTASDGQPKQPIARFSAVTLFCSVKASQRQTSSHSVTASNEQVTASQHHSVTASQRYSVTASNTASSMCPPTAVGAETCTATPTGVPTTHLERGEGGALGPNHGIN